MPLAHSRLLPPLAFALLASAVVPMSSRAASPFTLKSTTVELPDPGRMFPGSGAEAINNNCLGCHSAAMVLNQPNLPREAWQAAVEKMIHVYKAPVAQEDVPAIVDYLARTKGQ